MSLFSGLANLFTGGSAGRIVEKVADRVTDKVLGED